MKEKKLNNQDTLHTSSFVRQLSEYCKTAAYLHLHEELYNLLIYMR